MLIKSTSMQKWRAENSVTLSSDIWATLDTLVVAFNWSKFTTLRFPPADDVLITKATLDKLLKEQCPELKSSSIKDAIRDSISAVVFATFVTARALVRASDLTMITGDHIAVAWSLQTSLLAQVSVVVEQPARKRKAAVTEMVGG